eukprot:6135182-Pleurochrysis_carterae.AAC.1
MDLETLSLRDCTFLPYSGRYRHEILDQPASVSHMARDVEDLRNGGVVKRMLEEWVELAAKHAEHYDAEKARCENDLRRVRSEFKRACEAEGEPPSKEDYSNFEREFWRDCNLPHRQVYVYAHNGSRFDAIAVLHSIIASAVGDGEED